PPPLPHTTCAALTWRGLVALTRTGSRGRGRGLRQTLDRQARQRGQLTVGRKDDSGTAWATPLGSLRTAEALGLDRLHSEHRILRRVHEVIGADQRLAQAIGVLVGEALAVEVGVRRVNDAVMIRAD